jgi:gliding motility-associated-like protein
MKIFCIIILYLLLAPSQTVWSQSSTFDTDNEGWRTTGDPSTETPAWVSMGGNPGGYIRGTDAAIGGIWYFRAPAKFTGNKCEAYGRYLRWDQTINGTPNQQQGPGGSPDVLLFGGGLTLAYDNPDAPGTTWTHYDILLREDAGWRLNNNSGPVPTQAEFRAALANLTGLQIRGEFITGDDNGCLDNFILENNFLFSLDSANLNGDFFNDTLCSTEAPVCSNQALLNTEERVDSLVVRLPFPQTGGVETFFSSGPFPLAVGLVINNPAHVTLYNLGGATPSDFIQALQSLRYRDTGPAPPRGTRIVEVRIFTACGDMGKRFAYLPIFPPVDAGSDAQLELCHNHAAPVDLSQQLSGDQTDDAYWRPALSGGNGLFDVLRDPPGVFAYIIPPAGNCPGDTARVEVNIVENIDLGPDTTLCNNDAFLLNAPDNLTQWQWNNGSRQSTLRIDKPGLYTIQGADNRCTFSDSIRVEFYQCTPCLFYAPNVFSPNDDGWNDTWQIFLPCFFARYRLEVYDRWGNLVFAADDPEIRWDGRYQGREMPAGVYVWLLEWEGELLGKAKWYRERGEVTVVR